MARTAFIGLGTMGYPMAGHLSRQGHQVTVYNRSPEKAERWCSEFDGKRAATPAEAAAQAEFIFICVGNDDDLREVCIGPEGCFNTAAADSVIVDHTTTSAEVARELSAAAEKRGLHFIDAPVSGGQAGAENGRLTIMAGGSEAAYARAEPVMAAFAAKSALMGPAGYGQLTKMVNQICIAGLVQSLSEALHFGQRVGLDLDKVIDVISKGAAQSWQMENRYATMVQGEFDFGFAVDWMRKDLGIAMAEGEARGASLPVTRLVDGYYAEIQQMGGGRWDTSSLIARLEKAQD